MRARIIKITALAFAGISLALSAFAVLQPATPRYELQVTDYAGNLFIAGAGDDCAAAFQGAAFPDNWREINCVRTR